MWQRGIALSSCPLPRPNLGNEQMLSAPLRRPAPNWEREIVLSCCAWCAAPAQMWQRVIALSSGARPSPKLGYDKLVSATLRGPGPKLETITCSLLCVLVRGPGPNVATRNCSQLMSLAPAQTWQREIVLRSVAHRPQIGNENLFLAVVPGARPQPKCGNE